mgnify:CR=1 FL=1
MQLTSTENDMKYIFHQPRTLIAREDLVKEIYILSQDEVSMVFIVFKN